MKNYKPIPIITNFVDEHGVNHVQEQIQLNCRRIKDETAQLIKDETARIKSNPSLDHLLEYLN